MLYQQHVQFPLHTGEKAVFLVGHVISGVVYILLEFGQVFVEKKIPLLQGIDFVLSRLFFVVVTEIDVQVL